MGKFTRRHVRKVVESLVIGPIERTVFNPTGGGSSGGGGATGFVVLDSDGNSFTTTSFAVLDSDGNSFTVGTSVLDSDGNSFTVATA